MKAFLKKLLPNRLRSYEAIVRQIKDEPEDLIPGQAFGSAVTFLRLDASSRKGPFDDQFLVRAVRLYRMAVYQALGLRIYDTQLVAGLALADGYLLEMGTGEGKTLVAPFAAWMANLMGSTVDIVTANEYLAQRDASQMAKLYEALGMSVAVSLAGQDAATKRQVYNHSVVYGTATGFALDMLHDDSVVHLGMRIRPAGLANTVAIIDEADQVLIDDAKTPVVYSMSVPADAASYEALIALFEPLKRGFAPDPHGSSGPDGDYWLDLENKSAVFTDTGYVAITQILRDKGLLGVDDQDYGATHQQLLTLTASALGAEALLKKDVHYAVKDGQIVLIDALTGRLLPGRRWDAGLHQLLEAKEGLAISDESIVLGRISLQNYFKLYREISGMSGTILADAEEFQTVYGLEARVIEPRTPSQRFDRADVFCRTVREKLEYVVDAVRIERHTNRPILIVTSNAEQAAQVSGALRDAGFEPQVLTTANPEQEADILAGAGMCSALTVITSMAGRGVDIKLGGDIRVLFKKYQQLLATPVTKQHEPYGVRIQQVQSLIGCIQGYLALSKSGHVVMSDAPAAHAEMGAASAMLVDVLRLYELPSGLVAQAKDVLGRLLSNPHFQAGVTDFADKHPAGLLVIGFEHFESARADAQLRGRTGRQGAPGHTVFLTSLEDTLLTESPSGEQLRRLLGMLGKDDISREVIEERLVRKLILQEQRQGQGRAAAARQQLVKFDQTIEDQRRVYQAIRKEVLSLPTGPEAFVKALIDRESTELALVQEQGDTVSTHVVLQPRLDRLEIEIPSLEFLDSMSAHEFKDHLVRAMLERRHQALAQLASIEDRQTMEAYLVLREIDRAWVAHLEEMTVLRRGIHLRGHAKQDPHIVFGKEALALFSAFLDQVHHAALVQALTWRNEKSDPTAY